MFNVKKVVIILSVTVVVAFAIGAGIFFATGGIKDVVKGEGGACYNLNEEKLEKLQGIKEIYIESSSMEVSVKTEKREDLKAHFYGETNSMNKPKLETKVEGDTLTIKSSAKSVSFGICLNKLNLDISIPENYKSKLKVKSGAGRINLDSPMTLEELNLEASAGSISLNGITATNLRLTSSAGEVKGENITCENSYIKSTSGVLNLQNFKGNINQESSAGKVNIGFRELNNNNIKLKATAGNITLNLPKNSEFQLEADSTAGRVHCDFPITIKEKNDSKHLSGVVGSDKNKVNIDTSAGSINIKSKN